MMFRRSCFVIGLVLALQMTFAASAQEAKNKEKAVTSKADSKKTKVLRHVVFFKFTEETTEADLKKITDAFAALPKKIDAIKDFEWGTNNSPEGLSKGFTHCFFVTFADEKGRDEYLPHPAHKEFVTIAKPHIADVTVIDYWTQE